MRTDRTEAIIIDSIDYGESDRIVSMYTALYGKIRGMAKGAKRSRKRFPNTLETFYHVVAEVTVRKGLYWIHHCSLVEGFYGIREEIERFTYGGLFLEMVTRFTGEGHPVDGLFPLLLGYLRRLDRAEDPATLTLTHSIRLLDLLGYRPVLSRCVRCEGEIGEALFDYRQGGTVCHGCKEGAIPISQGLLKALQKSLTMPDSALTRLHLSKRQKAEGYSLLRGFIEYHLDRRLNSWRSINQLGGDRNGEQDLPGDHSGATDILG